MDDYRLKYILVGASGSGKSTIAAHLEKRLGLRRCITCTTRPPRPGEINGKDYYFKSSLDYTNLFEHAQFGEFEYGMEKDELTRGDFVILDPQGVSYYRQNFPNPLVVIQLEREGIAVDPARMARDRAAGFDHVNPDFRICGQSIEDTFSKLRDIIRKTEDARSGEKSLDHQLQEAAGRCSICGSVDNSNVFSLAR